MIEKKYLFLPALSLLIFLSACAGQKAESTAQPSLEHIDFISAIEKEECYLCGNRMDTELADHWGQDNIGIINANTFEIVPIKINSYDRNGRQIKEPQGVLISSGGTLGDSLVHAFTDPDRGNSHVDIQRVGNAINPDAIGTYLCNDCLDDFASHCFEDEIPPEIAVINFVTQEIRPLVESYPWFTFDNYAVACNFQEDGTISLLIYYCPPRFQDSAV